MKAMKTATLFTAMMTLASSAFASTGGSTHSGLLVWAFLGFCGLIVAFQFVPALMVLIGMFKGVTEGSGSLEKSTN